MSTYSRHKDALDIVSTAIRAAHDLVRTIHKQEAGDGDPYGDLYGDRYQLETLRDELYNARSSINSLTGNHNDPEMITDDD